MPKTLTAYMDAMDKAAAASGDAARFWLIAGTALQIWSSGAIPAASWDPRVQTGLMPLFKALEKFKRPLVEAVDARVFA